MINKIKWAAGLAIIFLLILATNLIDRREFKEIKKSISSIYEDRLVAQDLIFKISTLLNQKSMAVATGNATFFVSRNDSINTEIKDALKKIEITKLTNREEKYLEGFTKHYQSLLETEQKLIPTSSNSIPTTVRESLASPIAELNRELYELSQIQINEGRLVMHRAKGSANTMSSIANVEIIFLVIIGLAIQVVILLPKAKTEEDDI